MKTNNLVKTYNEKCGQCRSRSRSYAYKTFFMFNSAEHEFSKLDKSNLINLLGKLLTYGDLHRFCLSN